MKRMMKNLIAVGAAIAVLCSSAMAATELTGYLGHPFAEPAAIVSGLEEQEEGLWATGEVLEVESVEYPGAMEMVYPPVTMMNAEGGAAEEIGWVTLSAGSEEYSLYGVSVGMTKDEALEALNADPRIGEVYAEDDFIGAETEDPNAELWVYLNDDGTVVRMDQGWI